MDFAQTAAAVVSRSIGENLTLEGIDWSAVAPGACLQLGGDVVVQITCYTAPCSNITLGYFLATLRVGSM